MSDNKKTTEIDYSDRNVTLDAHEDRWAWRARLRANKATHLAWRIVVGVVGSVVTPGPGWVVVFLGLVILASEFEFAQRWLDFAKRQVGRWNDWVMNQPIWVRGLVALATLVLVWLVLWAYFAWRGVPEIMPDWFEHLLQRLPGVD